jgi:hypothetical protein
MSDDATVAPPMPDDPPAKPRRWPHPLVTGIAGLVVGAGAVGLAWGLSSGSDDAGSFTLKGALTLTSPTPLDYDHNACAGSGGYNDIVKGAAVTVYDASGKVVATGSLGAGRYASQDSTAPCVFPVAVPGVPDGSKFYRVEVSHRGQITVSSAEAKAGKFGASLG